MQLAYPILSPTYKISGLYAIFKEDICLYVGQSKNIPSRLSTHLTGRYEEADRIDVCFICEDFFGDFHERSKAAQTAILVNNENELINRLKPIENIFVDRSEVEESLLFKLLTSEEQNFSCSICIYLDRSFATVTNDFFLESIDKRVIREYEEYRKESLKYKGLRNDQN